MSTHQLSTPEKKAIETILSEAEHDYSPEDKIEEAVRLLDIESRKIWEDWDEAIQLAVIPTSKVDTNEEISDFIQKSRATIDNLSENESETITTNRQISKKVTSNDVFQISDSDDDIISQNSPKENLISKSKQKTKQTNTFRASTSSKVHDFPIEIPSYQHRNTYMTSKQYSRATKEKVSKISPPKPKQKARKTYQEVHEYNEYKKLRRENMECLEQIKLLENTLMKLNAENDALKQSLNASKIERAKQKAKIAYLKTENK